MQITDEMVEKLAGVLMGRVNAPEQEIYSAARDGLAAALAGRGALDPDMSPLTAAPKEGE